MAHDPLDPFRPHRETDGVVAGRVGDDEFVMVLGYDDLKAVCRDWRTFTNDAPFRVPIPSEHDVRSVRQLPIETDPPDHTDYRDIVKEPFSRTTAARIQPEVRAAVAAMVDQVLAGGGEVEVVRGFALPIQSRALALMLGRPESDAEEWISWGVHVFRDPEGGHASDLDGYLARVIDEAVENPGDDFFGLLATAEFRGRRLGREEMAGFANLTFAGGRDTVIGSIAQALHHLATHPGTLDRLAGDPDAVKVAVEELLRFYSPLTHIGRVVDPAGPGAELRGRALPPDSVVSLCYASANRDSGTFERADECVLDRHPNRHVAFGHGPHTCLGAPLARMVLATVVEEVAARVTAAEVVEAVEKTEQLGFGERRAGFDRLVLRLTARAGA